MKHDVALDTIFSISYVSSSIIRHQRVINVPEMYLFFLLQVIPILHLSTDGNIFLTLLIRFYF